MQAETSKPVKMIDTRQVDIRIMGVTMAFYLQDSLKELCLEGCIDRANL